MEHSRILVPLDGTALAETALNKAVQLAKPSGALLVLFRVADGSDAGDREAEDYLGAVEAQLADAGIKRVARVVWHGPVARAIIEAAELSGADLIVMASGRRGGTGELVLRDATTPVLVLRWPDARFATGSAGSARSARPTALAPLPRRDRQPERPGAVVTRPARAWWRRAGRAPRPQGGRSRQTR